MDELNRVGWVKASAKSYHHHSGAKIVKRGKLWIANIETKASETTHSTAIQAATWLEKSDDSFWTYGKRVAFGMHSNIWINIGVLEETFRDEVFTLSLEEKAIFPAFLVSIFKKHFFTQAECVKCSRPMTSLMFSVLCTFEGIKSVRQNFIVCSCGYPVWRLQINSLSIAESAIDQAERTYRRRQMIVAAGGKNSRKEIREIVTHQTNRCIYCNVEFTDEIRYSKDHLLAITHGGTDWALNIVLACRSCNSRRGNIPFRTYCRLLSPTQNKRILEHLRRRLLALSKDFFQKEALLSLCIGIAYHDPKHSRYRLILSTSSTARRNANINQLLPKTLGRILKGIR